MIPRRSVCGLAVRDGRYLLLKRPPGGTQGGKWEFPGGKVEDGETSVEAVRREWKEELELEVDVIENVFSGSFSNGGKDYVLEAWTVRLASGEPVLVEHSELAWVEPHAMGRFDLSDSDRQVADFLSRPR